MFSLKLKTLVSLSLYIYICRPNIYGWFKKHSLNQRQKKIVTKMMLCVTWWRYISGKRASFRSLARNINDMQNTAMQKKKSPVSHQCVMNNFRGTNKDFSYKIIQSEFKYFENFFWKILCLKLKQMPSMVRHHNEFPNLSECFIQSVYRCFLLWILLAFYFQMSVL